MSTELDLDAIRARHDEDHEHDGGCDTLDLLSEVEALRAWIDQSADVFNARAERVERLQAAVDAVRALVAPQWRSIEYGRNDLIDDICDALDEHLGGD